MASVRDLFEDDQEHLGRCLLLYGIPNMPLHRPSLGDLMIIRQIFEQLVETRPVSYFKFIDRRGQWEDLSDGWIADYYCAQYTIAFNKPYYK